MLNDSPLKQAQKCWGRLFLFLSAAAVLADHGLEGGKGGGLGGSCKKQQEGRDREERGRMVDVHPVRSLLF